MLDLRLALCLGLLGVLLVGAPTASVIAAPENHPHNQAENPHDPADIGKQHAIVGGRRVQPTQRHIDDRLKRLNETRRGSSSGTPGAMPPEATPSAR